MKVWFLPVDGEQKMDVYTNESIIEDKYADDRPWDMEWLDDDTIPLSDSKYPEDKNIMYRQKSE